MGEYEQEMQATVPRRATICCCLPRNQEDPTYKDNLGKMRYPEFGRNSGTSHYSSGKSISGNFSLEENDCDTDDDMEIDIQIEEEHHMVIDETTQLRGIIIKSKSNADKRKTASIRLLNYNYHQVVDELVDKYVLKNLTI